MLWTSLARSIFPLRSAVTHWSLAIIMLMTVGGLADAAVVLPVKINYQTTAAPLPAGYLKDDGSIYADRGNGYIYGWNVSHTDVTRDRNVNADQRLDTLCHIKLNGKWEIELPNGSYAVFVSIGDPSNASSHTLNIEGVNCWTNLALSPNQFANTTKTVTVSDGKLTVDQGAAINMATRINYIEISSASGNAAPTVATAAAAAPSPVTATTTGLSVLGADDAGEPALTYTWATTGTPPAAVTYSVNATNAAKATTATFTKAGSYSFQVTITDGGGLTATSTVNVTVNQTLTTIAVTPASTTVQVGGTQQFTAVGRDQFATALTSQPTMTWTVGGGGTISTAGLFTAGTTAGGPHTVTAASGGKTGTATVTVATGGNTPPTVATAASATPSPVTGTTATLAVLGADNGGEPSLTYSWATTGTPPASVAFSVNGTNAAKSTTATFTKAGSYGFQVTITDSGSLTVTSSVTVTVNQTLTTVTVSPASARVNPSATQAFTAVGKDQFGTDLSSQPTFTWTRSGGGTIASTGVFTAGTTTGGPHTITATSGARSGTATVIVNAAPTVATAAAASPSPVTGTTTTLSVLGADDAGEPNLLYGWTTTGTPPAAVTFSANNTNAAKSTVATFTKSGSYSLRCTIQDGGGRTVISNLTVVVNQTYSSVVLTPSTATVPTSSSQVFTASARDQFGTALTTQPAFTWTTTGGGTITPGSPTTTATFLAGATAGGPFTLTATSGARNATAAITIPVNAAPTVTTPAAASPSPTTLATSVATALGADDGGESNLRYTWSMVSSSNTDYYVTFSPNATNAAKSSTITFVNNGPYSVPTVTVQIRCTIADTAGLSVVSLSSVVLNSVTKSVTVDALPTTMQAYMTSSLTANLRDQLNKVINTQPYPPVTWSIDSGGGALTPGSLPIWQTYTAGPAAGSAVVRATANGVFGTKALTITANAPPVFLAQGEAQAYPNPVSSASTQVNAAASDDADPNNLRYTWTTAGTPPAPVDFIYGLLPGQLEMNGTIYAEQMKARFSKAGTYTLICTVSDQANQADTSQVEVVVVPVPTSISLSPAMDVLTEGQSRIITASVLDQFGNPLQQQPALTWALGGVGTITPAVPASNVTVSGLPVGGPYYLTASVGDVGGVSQLRVTSAGNQAPTIVSIANAVPSTVTGVSSSLAVLGADDGGEAALTYHWTVSSGPLAPVNFSRNGTNQAKNTVATFTKAGTYGCLCTVTDGQGLTTTSQVSVTVSSSITLLTILQPTGVRTAPGGSYQLHISGIDQFGQPVLAPAGVAWGVTPAGMGSMASSGLFTASVTTGWVTISASLGSVQAPTINLQVTTGDTAPPQPPIGLRASAGAVDAPDNVYTSATLQWDASTEPDISGYRIYQDGRFITTTPLSYTGAIRSLVPGQTYSLSVIAVDTSGNASAPAIISYTGPSESVPPTAPNLLQVLARTDHSLTIGGFSSSDDLGVGIAGYDLYRNGQFIARTTATYTDEGLSPAATYVYAARARDLAGAVSPFGRPLNATTAADSTAPSIPSGLSITTSTQSSITCSWITSSDNVAVTGYDLLIANAVVASSVTTSATIPGLKPGTSYPIVVRARDAIGNMSAVSSSVNGMTLADSAAPTVPGIPVLVSRSAGSITIGWTGSTDTNGVTGYQVLRNGAVVATTTVLTHLDRPLSAGVGYAYSVKAIDASNNVSAASGVLNASTLADTSAPTVPSAPYATAIGFTSVTLAWWPSTDDVSVSVYEVLKDGAVVGTTAATSLVVANLLPGTTGSFAVRAKDPTGNTSASSGSTMISTAGDVKSPTPPTNLILTAKTSASATLAWTAATDVGGSGVTSYDIVRDGAVVGATAGLTFSNTGLTASATYSYVVIARDAAGNPSSPSVSLGVTTNADVTVPSVPTGLAVASVTETSVSLTWSAASDNLGVAGYELLRGGVVVSRGASTNATDSGLVPNTAYTYTVRTYDAGANRSAASTAAVATTAIDQTAPSIPSGLIASGQTASSITLTWSVSNDAVGMGSYRVLRDAVQVGTTSSSSFVDVGLVPQTTVSYTVVAVDLAGNASPPSQPLVAATLPDTNPPTQPSAPFVTAVNLASVSIAWAPSSDNVQVAGYDIYRDGLLVASIAGTTWVDSGLIPATSYAYAIKSRDGAGNQSALSSSVSALTLADTVAPGVPGGLVWTAKTDHSVTVKWAAAVDPGGSGITGYEILSGGVVKALVTAIEWTESGLNPDTVYDYAVRSIDGGANRSALTSVLMVRTNRDETPPTAPMELRSTGQTSSSITLAWLPSTDNITVVGYRIYRGDVLFATLPPSTGWSDATATPEEPYTYQVTAYDAAGYESARSNPVSVAAVGGNRSVLVDAPVFDATQWNGDATYRTAWLAALEPGRVWQSADPGAAVPILSAVGSRYRVLFVAGSQSLAVTTLANAPVTFFCSGDGLFTANNRNVITVAANGSGIATVDFKGNRIGRMPIVAASPLSSGQVRFMVEVKP